MWHMTKSNKSSGLAQGFYLSEQFQTLEIETKDYREHPVIRGISSTRWRAYDSFVKENSKLADVLKGLPASSNAVQLKLNQEIREWIDPEFEAADIKIYFRRNHRLQTSGFLSGNKARNRLGGSSEADLLIGWSGQDTLIGGEGDDYLCGGKGSDRFIFSSSTQYAELERDEITDFSRKAGDRIIFDFGEGSVVNEFTSKPGQVTFAVWMAHITLEEGVELEPWMYCGTHIWVDRDGDNAADLFINLPGVSSFDRGSISFR